MDENTTSEQAPYGAEGSAPPEAQPSGSAQPPTEAPPQQAAGPAAPPPTQPQPQAQPQPTPPPQVHTPQPVVEEPREKDRGRRTLGIILIALGVVFLVNQFIAWDVFWPLILIAIGLVVLFRR